MGLSGGAVRLFGLYSRKVWWLTHVMALYVIEGGAVDFRPNLEVSAITLGHAAMRRRRIRARPPRAGWPSLHRMQSPVRIGKSCLSRACARSRGPCRNKRKPMTWEIRRERAEDARRIAALNEAGFGPGRFAKSAYRLREGVDPVAALSFVAIENGILRGSVRFWPIKVGGSTTLACWGRWRWTAPQRGRGIGIALMQAGIEAARRAAGAPSCWWAMSLIMRGWALRACRRAG